MLQRVLRPIDRSLRETRSGSIALSLSRVHIAFTIVRVESGNRPNKEPTGRADPTILPARLAEALGLPAPSSDLVDITISVRRKADDASGQPASSYTADTLQRVASLLEDLDADQRAIDSPTHLAMSAGAENQSLEQIDEGSKISGLKGKVTYGSVIATLSLFGQLGGYTLHDALAAGERQSTPPPAQHGHRADNRILSKTWEPPPVVGTKFFFRAPESKPLKMPDIGVGWDQRDTRYIKGLIKISVNGSEVKWGDEGEHSDTVEEASASRTAADDPDQSRPSDLPPDVEVKVTLPDGTEIAAEVPVSILPNR